MNKKMKVLVACEESQSVTIELRKLGHEAYSCDIIECSGGHPEWHIMGDVLPLLNGFCDIITMNGAIHYIDDKWDMIIAFPPCTHLSSSGQWAYNKGKDVNLKKQGIDFFMKFVNADCGKIAIENPIGIMSSNYRKPNQIIQPWFFGDPFSKSTCLWLKGLPILKQEYFEKPIEEYMEWIDKKTGKNKRQASWMVGLPANERAKLRSKTFPGIAKAMATQWT